jgi:hypothetical protein
MNAWEEVADRARRGHLAGVEKLFLDATEEEPVLI